MLGYFLILVVILTSAAQITIAVILVRKFLRTRETGFIWLGVATVIWPFASALLKSGEGHLIRQGHPFEIFPFNLVEHGYTTIGQIDASFSFAQSLVGTVLLLIAVLQLSRAGSAAPAIPSLRS